MTGYLASQDMAIVGMTRYLWLFVGPGLVMLGVGGVAWWWYLVKRGGRRRQ